MKTKYQGAERYIPPTRNHRALEEASDRCHGCDLYKNATQSVFGEGNKGAALMLVGEQPGNQEDLEGRPFVGPAGQLLDRALSSAGLARQEVYITNAVKHFNFEERGKRRIHKKPNAAHVRACVPWLQTEIALIEPKVVVALGATAAQAVLGSTVTISESRGKVIERDEYRCVVTAHPSSLLRIPSEEEREEAFQNLVEDLRFAAKVATKVTAPLSSKKEKRIFEELPSPRTAGNQ